MTERITRPKLFALLVGIDQYRAPITPLKGCINDVEKVGTYLTNEKDHFEVHLETLTNEKATKANIVSMFKTHLSKAEKKDTVLFYYSGHGTQEEADEVFWSGEADKKLEAVVCFDSVVMHEGSPTVNLLADKELRFLIKEISGNNPHIVSIFDCCHSGGNTRNGNFSDPNDQKSMQSRRFSMAFPKRDWSGFIFADTVTREDVERDGVNLIFSEGAQLQLAACQNDESAYELGGEGIFTKNLLEILKRCSGSISYHRLQSTIQGYLRHQFNQTPKIYTTNANALLQSFLNKSAEETTLKGSVSYNTTSGWILDMGSIQGMAVGTSLVLKDQSTKTYKAKVDSVHVTHSTVSFEDKEGLAVAKESIFETEITNFLTQSILVYVDPELNNILKAATLLSQMKTFDQLHLTGDQNTADYCLMKQKETLIVTTPGRIQVPLFPGIGLTTFSTAHVSTLLNYLDHLSRYTFVRYLSNPAAFILQPNFVSLEVFAEGDVKTPLPIQNEELKLQYLKKNTTWGGSIKIRLKNTTSQKLYVALCYLSSNYGVYTKLLSTGVIRLDSRAEVWAMDGDPIHFKLEPEILQFQLQESTSYLKLLISTEDFTTQLNTLYLDDLPGPMGNIQPLTKGLQTRPEVVHDWTSRLITIRMPNPELI